MTHMNFYYTEGNRANEKVTIKLDLNLFSLFISFKSSELAK